MVEVGSLDVRRLWCFKESLRALSEHCLYCTTTMLRYSLALWLFSVSDENCRPTTGLG